MPTDHVAGKGSVSCACVHERERKTGVWGASLLSPPPKKTTQPPSPTTHTNTTHKFHTRQRPRIWTRRRGRARPPTTRRRRTRRRLSTTPPATSSSVRIIRSTHACSFSGGGEDLVGRLSSVWCPDTRYLPTPPPPTPFHRSSSFRPVLTHHIYTPHHHHLDTGVSAVNMIAGVLYIYWRATRSMSGVMHR